MKIETEEQLVKEILDLCEEADINGVEDVKITRSLALAKKELVLSGWPVAGPETVTKEELEEILSE
jgi:hypothetical protein